MEIGHRFLPEFLMKLLSEFAMEMLRIWRLVAPRVLPRHFSQLWSRAWNGSLKPFHYLLAFRRNYGLHILNFGPQTDGSATSEIGTILYCHVP